jgi:cell division protein ZapA
MDDTDQTITIKIFGTEYPLKSSAKAGYIRRVAEYVDSKMHEVHKTKPNRPLHQIAILAAMNITDELLQHREVEKERHADFETKILELSDKLERGISEITEDR